MLNFRVANLPRGFRFRLIEILAGTRHLSLPSDIASQLVFARLALRNSNYPRFQIIASSDVAKKDLDEIVRILRDAEIEVPENWRYWPEEFPEYPNTEVVFYGFTQSDTELIRQKVSECFEVLYRHSCSDVIDTNCRQSPYAEIRAFRMPLEGIAQAMRVAEMLKDFCDLEIFYQTEDGNCKMYFWPKGASDYCH
jgi:hypothetical protein